MENVINTNLMGTIWLNKAVAKGMMRRKKGWFWSLSQKLWESRQRCSISYRLYFQALSSTFQASSASRATLDRVCTVRQSQRSLVRDVITLLDGSGGRSTSRKWSHSTCAFLIYRLFKITLQRARFPRRHRQRDCSRVYWHGHDLQYVSRYKTLASCFPF